MDREIFSKGTEVEAFFDDPDLRCAWFTATVLREPSRDKKIFLQFHTLLSDGKHQKPLQERLNVVNVRPLPPREAHRTFKMNEEVDALYDDGWWEGVITEVHGSDRFSVYLRGTKDQRVFPASVLRLRREWVNNSWVPPLEEEEDNPVEDEEDEDSAEEVDQSLLSKPDGSNVPEPAGSSKKHPSKSKIVLPKSKGSNVQKPEGSSRIVSSKSKSVISKPAGSNVSKPEGSNVPKPEGSSKSKSVLLNPEGNNMQKPEGISKNHSSMSKVKFEEGTEVEISSDQPGFLGAWFVATYVKEVRNQHLIEHRHFFTRSDGVMRLKERVDARHIRPLPPEIPAIGRFKHLEEVDAWYSESWWVGVISKVLDNSKYKVYFRHNKEELEFEHSNLRYHQDWVDGQWVRASLALSL